MWSNREKIYALYQMQDNLRSDMFYAFEVRRIYEDVLEMLWQDLEARAGSGQPDDSDLLEFVGDWQNMSIEVFAWWSDSEHHAEWIEGLRAFARKHDWGMRQLGNLTSPYDDNMEDDIVILAVESSIAEVMEDILGRI